MSSGGTLRVEGLRDYYPNSTSEKKNRKEEKKSKTMKENEKRKSIMKRSGKK
jgi:hypothetical protein